jgi:hypothetical protein
MRASEDLLVFVVIACSGCATVQRQGPRLKVEPFSHRCLDTHLAGRLTPEGDALKLTIVADSTCSSGETDTFTTERYAQSWVPATMLGVGAGAIVAAPILVGIGFVLSKSASQPGGTGGEVMMLGVLPGMAAGFGVAYAIGKTEARLPDGKPERVERLITSEFVTRAPSGVLRPDDDTVHRWQVQDGVVVLPIAQVQALNLKRLLLEGQLVEFADSSSQARVDALDDCRAAGKGWSPAALSCDDARRRTEAAARCARAGWSVAAELTAALQQASAACP